MIKICTKYGFDILIISGSYGGHRRHMTYDGRRTTPRVWHKLPTGELKNHSSISMVNVKKIQSTGSKPMSLVWLVDSFYQG